MPDTRTEFMRRLNEFIVEDELVSKEFWRSFQDKRASKRIPTKRLFDVVKNLVRYDTQQQFDLRPLMTLVSYQDKPLFRDIVHFTVQRYMEKPLSDLTLQQFQADLTRRLIQVGF